MERLGIHRGGDLKAGTLLFLQQHFGKAGPYYHALARGIDERPVRADRLRKSIGAETTFGVDLFEPEKARAAVAPLIGKVGSCCEEATVRGRKVTLKVKYADFQQVTRSRTDTATVASRASIEAIAGSLLLPIFPVTKGIRLLGVTLSSLATEASVEHQLDLPI
jgi:DNA polymerase IV